MKNEELIKALSISQDAAEKYAILYNFTPTGYLTLSSKGVIIDLNHRISQIFDYAQALLINNNFSFFVSDDTKTIFNLFLEKIFSCNTSETCEVTLSTNRHIPIYVQLTGSIIGNGEQCLVAVVDITEKKNMELALRESEKHYLTLTEISPVGIFRTDAEGSTTYVNPCWCQISGLTKKEAMGDGWLTAVHPDDREILNKGWKRATQAHNISSTEYRFAHTDGTIAWVLGHAVPEMNSENQIIGYVGTITDITERKRVEEKLRANEEKFRRLVQNITDAIIMDDAEGKILFANESYKTLFGFQSDDFTHITIYDNVAPEWKDELMDRHIRRFRGEEVTTNFEYEAIRIDGQRIWIEVNVVPIKDNDGTMIGTQSALRDITERKLIKDRIAANEEKYRSIVEWAPIGIYQTTIDGKFISVNQRLSEILGYDSIGDLQKRSMESDIYFEHRDRQLAIARFDPSGFVFNHELKWKKKDGTPIWISLTAHAIKDQAGSTLYYEGFIFDITQQKQTEEKITMLVHAIRSIGEGVSITDNDDILLYVNKTFLTMYQYEEHEVLGQHISMIVSPHNSPALLTKVNPATIDGGWQGELLNRKKDGSEFPVFLSTSVIRDENGKSIALIGVATDITERRKIQEEIKTLNAELEQRVADRTAELQATIKELEAFSYTVSHDLRAPLRAIHGFTSILFEDYEPKLDAEGKNLCFKIRENSLKMGQLIDDLLAFSRLGRSELNISPINMTELAGSVYHELTTPEMRRQIEFQLGELDSVSCDRTLLHQVWTNLISNAIKFSSHRDSNVIRISGSREKTRVVFSIQDNGTGFDMKYSNKLFGVFQRLHSVKEFEGTGVGLAIVQRIIHKHGGEVWAEGEIDKGATFYFSLPFTQIADK